jgi:hypothetical protein
MSHRLRIMEPRDLLPLWRMADAQNRRDGTNYPVPLIFEMDESKPGFGQLVQNVPLALVTERDGRVRQVHICLRTIEIMGWGGGREDMEFSAAHIPMMMDYLKRRGYEEAHTFVPQVRVSEEHAKLLQEYGMTRLDQRLAHFFRMT